MKRFRKLISLALALSVVVASTTFVVPKAASVISGNWSYTVKSGEAYIDGWHTKSGPTGSITLPTKIDGYDVTGIASTAFAEYQNLTQVTIPDCIKVIEFAAFFKCKALTKVNLGSVKEIGTSAFARCEGLKSIVIPDTVTSIGGGAFNSCDSLTSVTIGQNVGSIGRSAFNMCDKIKSIVLPDSLKSIGKTCFSGCAALTSVTFGRALKSIGEEAFFDTGLTAVTLPATLTTIDDRAFGYALRGETQYKVSGFSITSASGTEAHNYAGSNGFKFTECKHASASYLIKKSATCVSAGALSMSCNVCGYSMSEVTIKPSGVHNFEETLKPATFVSNGSFERKCAWCGKVDSASGDITKIGKVTVADTWFMYNGKSHFPVVSVVDADGNPLVEDRDYTLKFANRDSVAVAEYSFRVVFKGNYSGEKSYKYSITPREISISKVTSPKAGALKASWEKDASINGYQLQYSTSKNFKNAKSVNTGKKNYVLYKKVTGLKRHKRYYVRLRTYKTTGNIKFYSPWSDVKSVVVK